MPLLSKPICGVHGGSPPTTEGTLQNPSGGQLKSDPMVRSPRLGSAWGASDGGYWGSLEDEDVTHCCLPSGCPRFLDDPISLADPGDAVKVVCNNERCREGQWMHAECFQDWEEHILGYLRSCGRARSWSEKQRHQNLWTKKGYDLAFKVCDCKCGRGHLRYDTSYVATSKSDEERRQKKAKRRDRLPSVGNAICYQTSNTTGHEIRSPLRLHRSSFSSNGSFSGSSPPSSTGTTPVTPPGHFMSSSCGSSSSSRKYSFGSRQEFFADADQATAGNIFRHRTDLQVFYSLPHRRQNTYQIKTEDEGPHGNDEIRCTVLTSLSVLHATSVTCIICQGELPVFDKYPLIDGTFFLSPMRYPGTPEGLKVDDYRQKGGCVRLNAVCMRCMEGKRSALVCKACRTQWTGASLVIGTMYSYDIFAAVPCCAARLACNRCRQPLCDPSSGFKYFSDYSRLFRCPCCATEDHHFVKPLDEIFTKMVRYN